MNREILLIAEQLKDAYEGNPWFGRSVKELLSEVTEADCFVKLNNQHSVLELLWHMITWREFTIECLREKDSADTKKFEDLDWRELDHSDKHLRQKGLQKLQETQTELISVLQQQSDDLLTHQVANREYGYRKLLNGIVQHDIYHLGQIAYINKQLKNQQ